MDEVDDGGVRCYVSLGMIRELNETGIARAVGGNRFCGTLLSLLNQVDIVRHWVDTTILAV